MASFELLLDATKALRSTWNIFASGVPAFSVSALAMLLVAACLGRIDRWAREGNSQQRHRIVAFLKIPHALPLLIAPAVVTGLLVHFAQDNIGIPLSAIQNFTALAFIGFVQHVFIAYLILEHVLRFSARRAAARRHVANLPMGWRARRAAVHVNAAAPPLVLMFGVLLLLQHAMLAAPSFLTKKNAIVDLRQFLEREGPSLALRLVVAAIVAVAITGALVLLYSVSFHVSRLLLRVAATLAYSGQTQPRRTVVQTSDTPIVAIVVVVLSAFLQVSVGAVVLYRLIVPSLNTVSTLMLRESLGVFVSTVRAPGVASAMIASVVLVTWSCWYRSRSVQTDSGAWLVVVAVMAFTPPSVYASLVLPILTAATQRVLLWSLLVIWSAAIAMFMLYQPIFLTRYPELVNLRLLRTGAPRQICGAVLGSLGAVAPSAFAVAYILWIEDGIQSTIDPTHTTVSSLLYRSIDGHWSPSTLLGVLLGFVVWLSALIVIRIATRLRHDLVMRLLPSDKTASLLVGLLLYIAVMAATFFGNCAVTKLKHQYAQRYSPLSARNT